MGLIRESDADLVAASQRGERAAFGQLVTRYQDVVCAVSYSSTGNWALSEDVAQDTFIAAWRQLGQLREIERLRSWLCGIARNLARKARRRTGRESELVDDAFALDASPYDTTAQAEIDAVVRLALARIPETYREPLVLYYREDRSVREVADVLGIAESAALQRLSRGRRYLAAGVADLVEQSLRRPRKDLAPRVLAALPLPIPSRVDSPKPEGSTMFKLAIAAAALAVVGTTTAAVVHHERSTTPTAAVTAAVAPNSTPAPLPPAEPHLPSPVAATAPRAHTASMAAAGEEPPKLIGRETMAHLALERGPARGPADARVTIVVFQDLHCPFCGNVLATIDQLWEEYPGKLRLVVKQFPVHESARLAAEASFAADAQGKFWPMHDLMMAHQDDLTRDALVAYGQQAGLDPAVLADALDHHTYASAVAADVTAGKEIGVDSTPAFLINGREFVGAQSIEAFRTVIDGALSQM